MIDFKNESFQYFKEIPKESNIYRKNMQMKNTTPIGVEHTIKYFIL